MTPLTLGDFAPVFSPLLDQVGQKWSFYRRPISGRPLVLAFCGDTNDAAALIGQLRDGRVQLEAANIGVLVVNGKTVAANAADAERHNIAFPLLSDADGKVSGMYGLPPPTGTAVVAPTLILLNVNFRVVAVLHPQPRQDVVGEIVARFARAIPAIEPREIETHAPVLLIPGVLERDLCSRLIDLWESGGNRASGVNRSGSGKIKIGDNPSMKIRRDHYITDPAITRELGQKFRRRVVPEIFKAFKHRATYLHNLKVGCYESQSHGYFRAHRDGVNPLQMNRRWGMSINLNTDEYDGGHLRFAEYGPHLYRPPTGGAVIYAGSLLHEALDVTAGRRFVLLSFLCGDEEAGALDAHFRKHGEKPPAYAMRFGPELD